MEVFSDLKAMNVSSVDFQLRSLPQEALPLFVEMIVAVLRTRTDFELAASYLASFLKIHREALWGTAVQLSDDNLSTVSIPVSVS